MPIFAGTTPCSTIEIGETNASERCIMIIVTKSSLFKVSSFSSASSTKIVVPNGSSESSTQHESYKPHIMVNTLTDVHLFTSVICADD